jgi:hypothetical protein
VAASIIAWSCLTCRFISSLPLGSKGMSLSTMAREAKALWPGMRVWYTFSSCHSIRPSSSWSVRDRSRPVRRHRLNSWWCPPVMAPSPVSSFETPDPLHWSHYAVCLFLATLSVSRASLEAQAILALTAQAISFAVCSMRVHPIHHEDFSFSIKVGL